MIMKVFILYLCFYTGESTPDETYDTDIININDFPESHLIDDILEENIQGGKHSSEEHLKCSQEKDNNSKLNIQEEFLQIIHLENELEENIARLKERLNIAIKNKDITLKKAKSLLGWREVQDMFNIQHQKEIERDNWEWNTDWKTRLKHYIF